MYQISCEGHLLWLSLWYSISPYGVSACHILYIMYYVGLHPGRRTGSGRRRDEFVIKRNSHRVSVRCSDWKIVGRDDEALRMWQEGWVRDSRHLDMTCSRVCRYGLCEWGRVSAHGHVVLSPADRQN